MGYPTAVPIARMGPSIGSLRKFGGRARFCRRSKRELRVKIDSHTSAWFPVLRKILLMFPNWKSRATQSSMMRGLKRKGNVYPLFARFLGQDISSACKRRKNYSRNPLLYSNFIRTAEATSPETDERKFTRDCHPSRFFARGSAFLAATRNSRSPAPR